VVEREEVGDRGRVRGIDSPVMFWFGRQGQASFERAEDQAESRCRLEEIKDSVFVLYSPWPIYWYI